QFDVTTVGFWCDVLALEAVVGVSHLHSQSALTAEARALYNREFLEGLDTLDSRQYQEWLNRQRQRYRQLLERLGQNSNQIQLPGQLKAAQPASAGLPDQSDKPRPAQSGERRKQKREATAVSRVGMGVADRSAPLNQAPQVAFFHGRQRELKLLGEWVSNASCRLVIVLGMGGQGKTLLAAHCANLLATQQQERIEEGGQPFFYILWRSLVNAPPLAEVLHGWLEVLSGQAERQAEGGLDRQLDRLFTLLQRKRCLLVLDNLEGLLAAGERAGYFRVGYEEYGYFLEQFALYPHRSCLLVTSREEPQRLRLLMLGGQTVQSLR
ncbi:MAG TPA: NACHT domain-containing protein, partial [Caldilineaceae bacterium]|nr:NACHT domain-containing protein [Caldilineaceae bacterium]